MLQRIASGYASVARWLRGHKGVLLGGFCVLAAVACVTLVPLDVLLATPDEVDTVRQGQGPIGSIATWIAQLMNGIAMLIGDFIIILLGIILIPILNYDGFSTSAIVGLGWSLVRDVVNMFVVVVLLVIAILTIVGSPKANWQQQIPRLFIYVVLVNFSRTICGLLIDIGNVIMFQFVNALLEIGAGNFAELLKLNVAGDFSTWSDSIGTPVQLVGISFLQVALMSAVLAVVLILLLVMLYRIVVLWVLIIMSPAAFFLGGIKDVLGQAGAAYSEWWKKFSSAIILGPILTFFLWLALAAGAGGGIVTNESFPVGETELSAIPLKAFDMSQMTGLLLGLVLLVVGMQQASTAAASLGGVAARFVNEGMGMSIAKGALKWPSTYARGAYKAANTVAPETTAAVSASVMQTAGKGISKAGFAVSNAPILGSIPGVGYLGRKASEQGNKMYTAGEHVDEEQMKKARDAFRNAPSSYKEQMYKAMANNSPAFRNLSKAQQDVMYEDLATKTGAQKAAAEALIPKKLAGESDAAYAARTEPQRRTHDQLMQRVIKKTQDDIDAGHSSFDDAQKTNFKATKSQYLDATFAALGNTKAEDFVTDQDSGFDPRVVRARALSGANGNIAQLNTIRAAMNQRVVKVLDNGEAVTALHEAEKGTYGTRVADAATTGAGLPGVTRYAARGYGSGGMDPRAPRGAAIAVGNTVTATDMTTGVTSTHVIGAGSPFIGHMIGSRVTIGGSTVVVDTVTP